MGIELDYDQQVQLKNALVKIADQLVELNRKFDKLLENMNPE